MYFVKLFCNLQCVRHLSRVASVCTTENWYCPGVINARTPRLTFFLACCTPLRYSVTLRIAPFLEGRMDCHGHPFFCLRKQRNAETMYNSKNELNFSFKTSCTPWFRAASTHQPHPLITPSHSSSSSPDEGSSSATLLLLQITAKRLGPQAAACINLSGSLRDAVTTCGDAARVAMMCWEYPSAQWSPAGGNMI
jgi:hypothetical protein